MHDLHDALAPALAGSGVQIDFHEHIPELAETSERFMGHLRQRAEEKMRRPEGRR
jgi:hypothetical protein